MIVNVRELTPQLALIFRLTHVSNLPWIVTNGLHCRASEVQDPDFVEIGNRDLIQRRPATLVPIAPYGTLGDYVPFYFTPCSPMLLNIRTGRNVTRRPPSELGCSSWPRCGRTRCTACRLCLATGMRS